MWPRFEPLSRTSAPGLAFIRSLTNLSSIQVDGRRDMRAAVDELADRLPEPLRPLATLAYNYRWSWLPGGSELFAAIDPERFELSGRNPVRLLQESPMQTLRAAAAHGSPVAPANELIERLRAD